VVEKDWQVPLARELQEILQSSYSSALDLLQSRGVVFWKECSFAEHYQRRTFRIRNGAVQWSKGAFSKTKTIDLASISKVVLGWPSTDVKEHFAPVDALGPGVLSSRCLHIISRAVPAEAESRTEPEQQWADLELIGETQNDVLVFCAVLCACMASASGPSLGKSKKQ
jgi:hypothetical protein